MAKTTQIILLEKTLINKLIQEPDFIQRVKANDFISETAQNIFYTLKELLENEVELTASNIHVEINKYEAFSRDQIDVLFTDDAISDNSFSYIHSQLKKERVKQTIREQVVDSLMRETSSKEELNTDKIVESTQRILDELSSLRDVNKLLITPEKFMDTYIQHLYKRSSGKAFYDTGCSFLNKKLMEGFVPKKITTIFGASGVGKSSFGLYLVNKQINKQIPSLYISLEMDQIVTADRLIAQRNNIPIIDFYPDKDDEIAPHVFEAVEQERRKLSVSKSFLLVEESGLSLSDIEVLIRDAKSYMGTDYLICTIDLLTMVRDFNKDGNSKANDYEHAMNFMHELSKKLNVHFVGIVQAKRPSSKIVVNDIDDLEKFRPRIEEIKNSSSLEARSRIIISTYRERFYAERLLPNAPELIYMEDIMDVEILKQNMGPLGRIQYLYLPEYATLYPYEKSEDNDEVFGGAEDILNESA